MGVAIFWPAGRIDWWAPWALIAVMLGWIAATATVILRTYPDLLAERTGPRAGAKSWDVALMSAIGVITFVLLIVAGFDQRYGWTHGISLATQVAPPSRCPPWDTRSSSGLPRRTHSSRRSSASNPNAAIPSLRWPVPLRAPSCLHRCDSVSTGHTAAARLLVGARSGRAERGSAHPPHGPRRPHPAGRAAGLRPLHAQGTSSAIPGHLVTRHAWTPEPSRPHRARSSSRGGPSA